MAPDAIEKALSNLRPEDAQKMRRGILILIQKATKVSFGSLALRAGMQNARINTCHVDESEAIV